MLGFQRNKIVSVVWEGDDAFRLHGVLDDDMYGLEVDIVFGLSDLAIRSVEGKWNRWTTPECPRALLHLPEAVGLSLKDPDFGPTVFKAVGRKACRHFANLIVECCRAAEEAVWAAEYHEALESSPGLTLDDFLAGREAAPIEKAPPVEVKEPERAPDPVDDGLTGFIIDLHLHTAPASKCAHDSVEAMIDEAKRIGLEGICLTDHNHVWPRAAVEELRQRHGFLILAGNEIITDQGDMLAFGYDEPVSGVARLADLAPKVRAAGGVVIAPHPFRGFLVTGSGQIGLTAHKAAERSMFEWVDALECLNGMVTDAENRLAAETADLLNLPKTGGSDAHDRGRVGLYATAFAGPIHNEKDLAEAIKNGGRCRPVRFRKEKGL